ncbi:MFS transporter [Angustibacter aerolatus]|uniref:MFS transporter n=1 Tax=Angustibacter aerolatus TaxID=1162965 RepID=A0ABQ6JBY7_9ACTN|nr:MFS transporter [Angustibacter aerolatus]GMA84978.1 MFS transporter [Angustibacter aerolatus]
MANRWTVLATGTLAQAITCVFLYGIPFLVPYLRRTEGLTLVEAGTLAAAPSLGLVLTLVAWGALADRFGERLVMATGLALAGGLLLASSTLDGGRLLAWAAVGAAAASVNAASGRAVMGWFGPQRRGLAMGVRQTAQPLGVAAAGLLLPPLAQAHGVDGALLVPALGCLVAAGLVVLLVADPPRPASVPGDAASGSPYAGPTLWRLHAASGLLVVPQFAVAGFGAEFLVSQQGWHPTQAGRVLAAVNAVGAIGRIAAGRWSDAVGSRLRPMRQIAVGCAAIMLLLGVVAATGSPLVLVPLALASIVSVTDNGLGYTATAEPGRARVVGPGARRPEHRAEPRGLRDAAAGGRPRRRRWLRLGVRPVRRRTRRRRRRHPRPPPLRTSARFARVDPLQGPHRAG